MCVKSSVLRFIIGYKVSKCKNNIKQKEKKCVCEKLKYKVSKR